MRCYLCTDSRARATTVQYTTQNQPKTSVSWLFVSFALYQLFRGFACAISFLLSLCGAKLCDAAGDYRDGRTRKKTLYTSEERLFLSFLRVRVHALNWIDTIWVFQQRCFSL